MPLLDPTGEHHSMLVPGTPVEVWIQLDRSWADGFEVHDLTNAGYVVRRRADRAVLPPLPVGSVRRARD